MSLLLARASLVRRRKPPPAVPLRTVGYAVGVTDRVTPAMVQFPGYPQNGTVSGLSPGMVQPPGYPQNGTVSGLSTEWYRLRVSLGSGQLPVNPGLAVPVGTPVGALPLCVISWTESSRCDTAGNPVLTVT